MKAEGDLQGYEKFLETFNWKGEEIQFTEPFCIELPNGKTSQRVFQGKILPGRTNDILITAGGTLFHDLGTSGTSENCSKESEIGIIRSVYALYLHDYNKTLTVTITDPVSNAFKLTYAPDTSFEPLSKQDWRLTPKNGAPIKYCSTLRFGVDGTAGIRCCNSISYNVTRTDDRNWSLTGGMQTLRGCKGARGKSDGKMTKKLLQGVRIGENGELLAAPDDRKPYIFEPVAFLDSDVPLSFGTWRLTSVMRIGDFSSLSPGDTVQQADDLQSLETELTLDGDQIRVTANCAVASAPIIGRRGSYVRTGMRPFSEAYNLPDCEQNKDPAMVMSRHFPHWIVDDRGGVLRIVHDKETDSLEIMRMGRGFRLYKFERLAAPDPH